MFEYGFYLKKRKRKLKQWSNAQTITDRWNEIFIADKNTVSQTSLLHLMLWEDWGADLTVGTELKKLKIMKSIRSKFIDTINRYFQISE